MSNAQWQLMRDVVRIQVERKGILGAWDRVVSRLTGRPLRTVEAAFERTYFIKPQASGHPFISDLQERPIEAGEKTPALRWSAKFRPKDGVTP